mgnify:CR=1 FL=1
MYRKEFRVNEADLLTDISNTQSLDPQPSRTVGINPLVIKDMIGDHLRSLRMINRSFDNAAQLDTALAALENEYYKIFGQRLIELKTQISKQDKAAVLELRRALNSLAKEPDPDLSYRGIDSVMKRISKLNGTTPESLHDAFVEIVGSTPDKYAEEKHTGAA